MSKHEYTWYMTTNELYDHVIFLLAEGTRQEVKDFLEQVQYEAYTEGELLGSLEVQV